jgi:hypothetical protein
VPPLLPRASTLAASIGVAIVVMSACGGSTGGAVVARVNGHAITRASLEHWTRVEAVLAYDFRPTKPVPKGVVPDPPDYANCIAYLRAHGSAPSHSAATPTTAQLKRQCRERYEQLQSHALNILITDYWTRGEAEARGVTVTEAEVGRTLRYLFPTKALLQRFVALSGETVAEQRFLLATKIQALLEQSLARRGFAGKRLQRRLAQAAAESVARWTARTDCSPGYVVAQCRQYRGSKA